LSEDAQITLFLDRNAVVLGYQWAKMKEANQIIHELIVNSAGIINYFDLDARILITHYFGACFG